MGDHFMSFAFPDVREEDASAFRDFMKNELIAMKMIGEKQYDIPFDSNFVDSMSHLSTADFFDSIYGSRTNESRWKNLKHYGPLQKGSYFFPVAEVRLCVGRYVNFWALMANDAFRCPACQLTFEREDDDFSLLSDSIFQGLYQYMDGYDIPLIKCPSCHSMSIVDTWKNRWDGTLTACCFFHISVWHTDTCIETRFENLLKMISGHRIAVDWGDI